MGDVLPSKRGTMTWLEETLSDILDQLRALGLTRSAEVNTYVQGLARAEREDYIRRYEAFWFPVTTIFSLLASMLLAVKELERLGRQSRESASTPDEQDLAAMMEAPYRVAAQS